MPLLSRPSAAMKYLGRPIYGVRPGKTAQTRRDGTQLVFETETPRWQGALHVGPLDRSTDAETTLSWLRRWIEDASNWTEIPALGVTAADPPDDLTVSSVSSSGVITASAAHNLAKGEGVRIDGLFGVVLTVPSTTTFRLYPEAVADNASDDDAIEGTRDILAKAVQPAELPMQLVRGKHLAVAIDWIEK